jgi:hypothetical protein
VLKLQKLNLVAEVVTEAVVAVDVVMVVLLGENSKEAVMVDVVKAVMAEVVIAVAEKAEVETEVVVKVVAVLVVEAEEIVRLVLKEAEEEKAVMAEVEIAEAETAEVVMVDVEKDLVLEAEADHVLLENLLIKNNTNTNFYK